MPAARRWPASSTPQRYRGEGVEVEVIRVRLIAFSAILSASLGALLLDSAGSERAWAGLTGPRPARATWLTTDIIQHSMVPSADLPLVDILTEKIPAGLTERGTSFYLGNGFWLSARHVTNADCGRIIMIINGKNVDAQIVYLDEAADLAVLRTPIQSAPAFAVADPNADPTEHAYAFGFPQGTLGA